MFSITLDKSLIALKYINKSSLSHRDLRPQFTAVQFLFRVEINTSKNSSQDDPDPIYLKKKKPTYTKKKKNAKESVLKRNRLCIIFENTKFLHFFLSPLI